MSAAPILHTVPSTPGPQRPPFAAGTPKSARTTGAYPRTPFPQDVPPSDDEAESGEDTDDEAVPRAVKRNAKSDAASSYFPSLQHATPPPTHLSSDAPPPVRTAPNTPGYDALLLTDGSTVAQKESEAGTTMPVGFTPPNHYTPVSELVPVIAQFPLPITSTLSDSTTSTSSYPSSAPTSPESFDSGAKAGIIASSVSAAIGLASPTTAAPTVTNSQARGAPPSSSVRPLDTPSAPSQSGKASAVVGRKPSLRRTLNASTVSGAKDTTSVEHKPSLFRRIRTKLAGGAGVAR